MMIMKKTSELALFANINGIKSFCVAVVLLATCIAATVDPLNVAKANLLKGPAALWDNTTVIPGRALPTIGYRAAISSLSVAPSMWMVPAVYNGWASTTQSIMVQVRVPNSDGILDFPELFLDTVSGVSCSSLIVPVSGVPTSISPYSVNTSDVADFAGGFITCDWTSIQLENIATHSQPLVSTLAFFPPFQYDVASYFDVLVWVADASSLSTFLAPEMYYVAWAPMYIIFNNTNGTANASVNSFITESTAGYYFMPMVTTSFYDIGSAVYLDVGVFPLASSSTSSPGGSMGQAIPLSPLTNFSLGAFSDAQCTVSDVTSYLTTVVPANTPLNGAAAGFMMQMFTRTCPDAYSAISVPEMMDRCNNDQTCLGFDTALDSVTGQETTLCFITFINEYPMTQVDVPLPFARVMHWKRSGSVLGNSPRCSVQATEMMDVQIQVASANVEAVILVNGVVVTSCLPDPSFCNLFDFCANLRVASNATIQVIPGRITEPICPRTYLQVQFMGVPSYTLMQENVDTRYEPYITAQQKMDVSRNVLQSSQPQLFRQVKVTPDISSLYVFGFQISGMNMFVAQSGFGAVRAGAPAFLITPFGTEPYNVTTCGGSAGWAANAEGWDNQCDVFNMCPQNFLNSSLSDFRGYVRIDINWAAIFASGNASHWSCDPRLFPDGTGLEIFLGLSTSSMYPWEAGTPGAAAYGDQRLRPVLLLDQTVSVNPSFLLNTGLNLSYSNTLAKVSRQMLTAYSIDEASYTYLGNETLGCVIDFFSSDSASCTFPIPAETQQLALTIEDANLVNYAVSYKVMYGDVIVHTGVCGGNAGYIDGASSVGSCGIYRTCALFLTSKLFSAFNISNSSSLNPYEANIVLSVPRGVMSGGLPCPPRAFSAALVMSNKPLITPPCNQFQCSTTGDCVSLSAVCDGSKDCTDGSDETNCFNWYDVELGATLNLTQVFNASALLAAPSADSPFNLGFTMRSAADCKALALRNASSAFAFNSISKECIVYRFTAPATALFTLNNNVVPTPGFTTYTTLTSPLQYSTCTDRFTCSGQGKAGTVSSTGACACICGAMFSGSTCNTFQDMATDFSEVFLLFPINTTSPLNGLLNTSSVEGALKKWVPLGRFGCEPPLRVSVSAISLVCTDDSSTLTEAMINNASALDTFNFYFRLLGPGVNATALAPTSIPKFEKLDVCSLAADATSYDCALPGAVQMDSIVISMTPTSASAVGLNFSLTFPASSRRSASTMIVIACPPESLAKVTGRSSTSLTCLLDLRSYGPLAGYSIIAVDNTNGVVTLNPGARSLWRRSVLIPNVGTNPDPKTVEQNFTGYMAAAIALILLGGCLLCLVFSLAVLHRAHLKRLLRRTQTSSVLSNLQKVVFSLFIRVTRVDHLEDGGSSDEEVRDADGNLVREQQDESNVECACFRNKNKWSFMCASFWLCVWIVGIFLILFFITSSAVASDTWLIVERFSDASCQNSTLSSTPQASFYVTDSSATVCTRRHIAGSVSTNFYFAGWCSLEANTTNVIVKFRSASTYAACQSADWTQVPSDACIPSQYLWGSSSDLTYTRLVCPTAGNSTNRFGYLLALSQLTDPTIAMNITQVKQPSGNATPYGFTQIGARQAQKFNSYGAYDSRYDTTTMDTTPIPTSGSQLLIQEYDELFSSAVIKSNYYSPQTAALEYQWKQQYVDNLSSTVPTDLQSHVPSLPGNELPIGQLYGNFNKSNEVSGTAAGVTSTRYYGLRRTKADIGAYIDKKTIAEGQGITVSCFIRVTERTYGFAWAVTDGFEDPATGSSPILDQILTLLTSNADGNFWFTSDYSVYSSLFVDGPGHSLKFIYAYPKQLFNKNFVVSAAANQTSGKTLGILSWDLDQLSLQRVMNGLWHQVHIVVRMETNMIKAQLIVDGETSRSTVGWNQCFNDDIKPINYYPEGQGVYVYNKTQNVFTDGILWTGYLNGGVSSVAFYPWIDDMFAVWKASSPAVQAFNHINETGYIVLGWILFGMAAFLGLYLFITTARAMYVDSNRNDRALVSAMYLRYVNIITAIPADAEGKVYKTLKYTTAKRWLDLTDRQVGQFLDELQQCTATIPQELVRVLYLSGDALRMKSKKNVIAPMPTAEEWEKLINDDDEAYIKSTTRNFPWHVPGHSEEDAFQINIDDVLQRNALSGSVRVHTSAMEDDGAQIQAVQQLIAAAGKAKLGERKQEAGEVNTGNLGNLGGNSGGGAGQLSMQSNVDVGVNIDFKQIFFPVLSVMQSLYLWISSSTFAVEYLHYFSNFFSFISIDFVVSFQLPTLVTPLVQLLVGLIAFLFLLYLIAMDEIRFSWYVARYVLKRDRMEMVKLDLGGTITRKETYVDSVLSQFPNPFGKYTEFPIEYELEVLPVQEAMRIDRFVGVAEAKDEEADGGAKEFEGDTISIKDRQGHEYQLTRDDDAKRKKELDQALELKVSTTDKSITPSEKLDVVGVFCRHHKERRLSPQVQTDVWPFLYAPECCVSVNGVRCSGSGGVVYSCQYPEPTEDGSLCLCDFAVCERHYRGGLFDGIYADVLGVVRTAQLRGNGWIIATIVMLVSNAAYMPFVKTAIMILACHPVYQCEFSECHNFSNQKYLLAFFLALCVVVMFGFGLPFLQAAQLYRRRSLLMHIFFSKDYEGRYEEKDDDQDAEKKLLEKLARGKEDNLDGTMTRRNIGTAGKGDAFDLEGTVKSEDSPNGQASNNNAEFTLPAYVPPSEKEDAALKVLSSKALFVEDAAADVDENDHEDQIHDEALEEHKGKSLLMAEWSRFLSSDPTVLGTLYKSLEFNWIFLSPIILLWKVVLICPAVFLPASSFGQAVGIAVTEVGFAVFMFFTAPFISPMVDLMYRVGSVHQILFLGLQNFDTVARYRGTPGFSKAMVILTFIYLAFSVGCVLYTSIGPQIRKALDKSRSTTALEELGFQYTLTTSLYLVPAEHAVRARDRNGTENFQAVQGAVREADQHHQAAAEDANHGQE